MFCPERLTRRRSRTREARVDHAPSGFTSRIARRIARRRVFEQEATAPLSIARRNTGAAEGRQDHRPGLRRLAHFAAAEIPSRPGISMSSSATSTCCAPRRARGRRLHLPTTSMSSSSESRLASAPRTIAWSSAIRTRKVRQRQRSRPKTSVGTRACLHLPCTAAPLGEADQAGSVRRIRPRGRAVVVDLEQDDVPWRLSVMTQRARAVRTTLSRLRTAHARHLDLIRAPRSGAPTRHSMPRADGRSSVLESRRTAGGIPARPHAPRSAHVV